LQAKGVSGTVGTSNHIFTFTKGYPYFLRKQHWLRKIQPAATNVYDLAGLSCLLDTNGAYQLATQWLTALSIDVAALEKAYPKMVLQIPNRSSRKAPTDDSQTHLPLFLVRWGTANQRTVFGSPVGMMIFGATKEVVELFIGNTNFFTCQPLTLTNAAQLLGSLPPKRKFVEDYLGGEQAYDAVAKPDWVEVVLMGVKDRDVGNSPIVEQTQAVRLNPEMAKDVSALLLDFDSYRWRVKMFHLCFQHVKVTFGRGERKVSFLICPECDDIHVAFDRHIEGQTFQPAHDRLMKLLLQVFPNSDSAKWLRRTGNE
jgi:hypothetical protein